MKKKVRWFSVNPNNSSFISTWRVKPGIVDSLDSKLQDFWCFVGLMTALSFSVASSVQTTLSLGAHTGTIPWHICMKQFNWSDQFWPLWHFHMRIIAKSDYTICGSIFVRQCFGLSDLQCRHPTVVLQPDNSHLNPALIWSAPFLPPQPLQG